MTLIVFDLVFSFSSFLIFLTRLCDGSLASLSSACRSPITCRHLHRAWPGPKTIMFQVCKRNVQAGPPEFQSMLFHWPDRHFPNQ